MTNILSLIIFAPLVGMLAILFTPRREEKIIKTIAACTSAVPLFLIMSLWCQFDRARVVDGADAQAMAEMMQFTERTTWISVGNLHVDYYVGVDGLSFPMVFLTGLLAFICIIASWGIDKGVKGYFALFLLLETGIMGTFCALDLFLFFVFWEVMLLPMYFLIGIWGGPRKEYAAIKFFLYTFFGSVFLLIGLIAIYFGTSAGRTFDLFALAQAMDTFPEHLKMWVFFGFFVAFAIKVPVFPFHTWLPDAHVEAPTAVSVILAGVLLKLGTYGMLRISYPMMPGMLMKFIPVIAVLAWVNIIYGAMCAMAQTDLKKLVAYSSISHMGIVMLGMCQINSLGFNGAALQMFNHGTVTAMMFLLVGVIYDRAHHREINGFGGLGVVMPVYTGLVSIAFFAGLGLPGLSSFISEAMVFLGGFDAIHRSVDLFGCQIQLHTFVKYVTVISIPGIVVTAGYVLWTLQRVWLGPLNEKYKDIEEISTREIACLVPLLVIVLILGVYPAPILDIQNHTLELLLKVTGA